MTTWSDLLPDIRNAIQDDIVDSNGQYKISDAAMLRLLNYALDWASNRHPVQSSEELVVTDMVATPTVSSARIVGVYGDSGECFYATQNPYPDAIEYYASPTAIRIGDSGVAKITVAYLRDYTRVVDANAVLPIPQWMEEAVYNYVCSRALSRLAVASGDVSQWDTRTDSGNPEHNPLLKLAEHYEALAEKVLSRRTQL